MSAIRKHVGVLAVATLFVLGISYVAAQEPTSDEIALSQQDERRSEEGNEKDGSPPEDGTKPSRDKPRDERARKHHGARFGKNAIRGEFVVEHDGKFVTVRFDRGILESVDGTTLVIKEADGTVVEVATSDQTKIGRDGEQATVADLEPGDHVFTHREKEGDSEFVTTRVRAVSPERWAEMEAKRVECRENPEACRARRMDKREERRRR